MLENNFDSLERNRLAQQAASGARWFFWIAALSLITSVASLSGSNWRFFASLGITQILDAIFVAVAKNSGDGAKIFAFFIDLIIGGIFAVCGLLALKRQSWAFIGGIVLFGLDSLIFLIGSDWLGFAFHGFVLFCLVKGYMACSKLVRLERELAVQGPPQPDAAYGSATEAVR